MQRRGPKTKGIQGAALHPLKKTFLHLHSLFHLDFSSKEAYSCVWDQLFIVFLHCSFGKTPSPDLCCLGLPGVQLLL